MNKLELSKDGRELIKCPTTVSGHVVIPDGVVSIKDFAFSKCQGITSVEIPDTVTHIGTPAFFMCDNLKSVILPYNDLYIGDSFAGCYSIEHPLYNKECFVKLPTDYKGSYTVPDGITRICGCAFNRCENLTSVEIPDCVTWCGSYAFENCPKLERPVFNKHLLFKFPTKIEGDYSFTEEFETIEIFAFEGCTKLTSLRLPNSVKYFKLSSFCECDSLQSIFIPEGVGEIITEHMWHLSPKLRIFVDDANPKYCDVDGSLYSKDKSILYHYCDNGATDFIIPESVRIINEYAFSQSHLKTVRIGENVVAIGKCAFIEATVSKVYISEKIEYIGENAFLRSNIKEMHIRRSNPLHIVLESNEFDDGHFDMCARNCTLFVPVGSVNAYRNHYEFRDFKKIAGKRS